MWKWCNWMISYPLSPPPELGQKRLVDVKDKCENKCFKGKAKTKLQQSLTHFIRLFFLLLSPEIEVLQSCVLYTKTYSSLHPKGAFHVNNPNYTETTGDSCFSLQNCSFVAPTRYLPSRHTRRTQPKPEWEGDKCAEKQMKSPGCLQWRGLYLQLPPPLFLVSRSSLHAGAEGHCLLGEGL